MEHRRDSRFPLKLEVELWQDEKKCGSYKTCDVSYGGLFIEGCHHKLTNGEFVTANIKITGTDKDMSGKLELFPMKALTVHTSARGAGLMWANDNESFFRFLDEAADMAAKAG